MLLLQRECDAIISAAIEVHRCLGPGLLEEAYQACLAREFELRRIEFVREVPMPVTYKGIVLPAGYRMDFLVYDAIVVETKAVLNKHPAHRAQLLAYLKMSGCRVGLLLNFSQARLIDGLARVVLDRARVPLTPTTRSSS